MLLYFLGLVLIEVFLFFINYSPNTYLLGWDNVMPEFDIALNLKRALFGVWQEYRGLGLPDGMAHTANLIHTFYIAVIASFLPESLVRYVSIHTLHLTGGMAMFLLLRSLHIKNITSFIGSAFYMVNLGVIQMFYAPLEVFAFHFIALPLTAVVTIRVLEKFSIKSILLFFLITLLMTPQSFVPTFFIVLTLLLASILFFHFIQHKNWRKPVLLFVLFLAINSFWLLPYIVTVRENSRIITNTRINQFSSEEIFYRNKAFGDPLSVLQMKGFMFNTTDLDIKTYKSVPFMATWQSYTNSPLFYLSYFPLLILAILGIVKVIKDRENRLYPFLVAGAISFFFLANSTPVLEQANNLLRIISPTLGEAFRFPFTKFITLFAFVLTIFLALGLAWISNRLNKKTIIISVLCLLMIVGISFPAFKGNFFSPMLKVNLPEEYREFMKYSQSLGENERIALFPIPNFWNWQYGSWGFRGSGFLWYGVSQPILARQFDPWSLYNEQFYNEASYAFRKDDAKLFRKVLEKYSVSYILLDSYTVNASSTKPVNYSKLNQSFDSYNFLKKQKSFGMLTLYKVTAGVPWIYTLNSEVKHSSPMFISAEKDTMLDQWGSYISQSNEPLDLFYPFPSLSTVKLPKDQDFKIQLINENLELTSTYEFKTDKNLRYVLKIPNVIQNEYLIPVRFTYDNGTLSYSPINPTVKVNDISYKLSSLPITLVSGLRQKPELISLNDISQNIQLEQPGFLLNNYLNTVTITSGGIKRIYTIDTNKIDSAEFEIPVEPDDTYKVVVIMPVFKSPFTYTHLVQDKKYTIDESIDNQENIQKNYSNLSIFFSDDRVTMKALAQSGKVSFWLDNLSHQGSYIILVDSTYIKGLPLSFYVDNAAEKRPELESRLSKSESQNVFVIPETEKYFQGYGLHFSVKSVGKEKAESKLNSLSVYPFPVNTLQKLRFELADPQRSKSSGIQRSNTFFEKMAPFLYFISQPTGSHIVLSQAYDDGWTAYSVSDKKSHTILFPFIFGKKIQDHSKANNWANSWPISAEEQNIIVIFLPQYLVFVGFALMFFALFFVLFSRKRC